MIKNSCAHYAIIRIVDIHNNGNLETRFIRLTRKHKISLKKVMKKKKEHPTVIFEWKQYVETDAK